MKNNQIEKVIEENAENQKLVPFYLDGKEEFVDISKKENIDNYFKKLDEEFWDIKDLCTKNYNIYIKAVNKYLDILSVKEAIKYINEQKYILEIIFSDDINEDSIFYNISIYDQPLNKFTETPFYNCFFLAKGLQKYYKSTLEYLNTELYDGISSNIQLKFFSYDGRKKMYIYKHNGGTITLTMLASEIRRLYLPKSKDNKVSESVVTEIQKKNIILLNENSEENITNWKSLKDNIGQINRSDIEISPANVDLRAELKFILKL